MVEVTGVRVGVGMGALSASLVVGSIVTLAIAVVGVVAVVVRAVAMAPVVVVMVVVVVVVVQNVCDGVSRGGINATISDYGVYRTYWAACTMDRHA